MKNYFEMATILYNQGDKVSAFNAFLELAIDGDAEAQAMVGYMFENGEGTKKDISKALMWYEKSASSGNSVAQFNLGYIYSTGKDGIREDRVKAFEYFLKAARAGSVDAMYSVAYMLEKGEGVDKNLKRAINWYELAANYGDGRSKKRLKKINKYGF